MWQILKAELGYWRDGLILTYTIAAGFLVAAVLIDSWGFYNLMWNTTITYFIFMGIVGGGAFNEKRYRLFNILPVRPLDVAVADALFVLLVQLGMPLLWIIYLVVKPEQVRPETLWVMVSDSAMILTVITIFGIHFHAHFFETKKYQRMNWLLLLLSISFVVMLYYFGALPGIARLVWRYYSSRQGAFAIVLLWIGVTALSSEMYLRRRSYLA